MEAPRPPEPPGSPRPEDARRCPNCGALATADAEWCGQCFTALPPPGMEAAARAGGSRADPAGADRSRGDPPAEGVTPSPPAQPAQARAPTWPCTTCGHDNPIELDACSVCGTSFAAVMRSDERPAEVDPKDALVASLIFPGLGHRKLGRPLDGFARGALFAIMCTLAIILAFAPGSGVLKAMFALYLLLALAVYAGSAWEAYRMAGGAPAWASTRQLLWTTAAIVIVSVLVLALSVITVAKR